MDQNDKSQTRLCQRLLDDNTHNYAQRPKQVKTKQNKITICKEVSKKEKRTGKEALSSCIAALMMRPEKKKKEKHTLKFKNEN